ncbi:MAG: ankyrin repeat domain-containing protein, partial [Blastocatellia bacterium]|nr:ankyrin repeat domain-containing protein [Blastocatellia bacterium]
MKRRLLKKQLRRIEQGFAKELKKEFLLYQSKNDETDLGIRANLFVLLSSLLQLESLWPKRERWLDTLYWFSFIRDQSLFFRGIGYYWWGKTTDIGGCQFVEPLLVEFGLSKKRKKADLAYRIRFSSFEFQHLGMSLREHMKLWDLDKDNVGNFGISSLMHFATQGDFAGTKALIGKETDVNKQAEDGFTALMLAVMFRHTIVVDELLRTNTDVNIQSNDGITALMLASFFGYEEIVERLLLKGANCSIRDNFGETALEKADRKWFASKKKSYKKIVEMLKF